MRNLIIAFIFLSIFVLGCSTKYKPAGFGGGYEETQLDTNVFEVSFRGNGYTRKQQVKDFAMLRCAELTKMNGFRYFATVSENVDTKTGSFVTPTNTTTRTNITGSAYSAGNTTYGSATGTSRSTTTGGQTITFRKSTVNIRIVMLDEKPKDIMSYNARFIIKNIKKKYDIE